MYIGSHVSFKGKEMLLGSVKESMLYGSNCFMIYTGPPQSTRRKKVEEFNLDMGLSLMKENNMDISKCVVHAPYIVNLANPSDEKHNFGVSFLSEEIRRTSIMGIKQIVLHPGAHLKQGSDIGVDRIVKGIDKIIENTMELDVLIALETMSGKGTEVGRTFDEIGSIIKKSKYSDRISVCFDTCHVHDAGYDIVNNLEKVLEEFDNLVGLEKISVIHLNDSKNPCGAHKDRHENLGLGYIGYDTICNIVHHPKFKDVPKFLETPYVTLNDGDKEKVLPPYKTEIQLLKNKENISNLLEVIRSTTEKK